MKKCYGALELSSQNVKGVTNQLRAGQLSCVGLGEVL